MNAGDPAWFDTLRHMRFDTADKLFGIDELLTTWEGRGLGKTKRRQMRVVYARERKKLMLSSSSSLGCDGLFLDTIDTAAPNFYTSPSDENYSKVSDLDLMTPS